MPATSRRGDKYRQEVTPYDQSSTDLPYILRTMMFYEAAGGRRYTGLWNAYQGFVDLSDLLKADRAILVAQGPASPERRPPAAPSCSATAGRWPARKTNMSRCTASCSR